MRMTVPLNSSLFKDSQSGTARLVEISKFLVASWRDTLLFLTLMTSLTFRAYDGDADLAAVHRDVAVADHLAGGGAGVAKAEVKHDVVQARFQNLQHLSRR